jgi:hypothetical protein
LNLYSYEFLGECILNSRELQSLHKLFIREPDEEFNDDDIIKITTSINKIKKIKDAKFDKLIINALESYNSVAGHKKVLNNLYSEKFDPLDRSHTEMLFQIWEIIKGDRNIQLFDKKWRKLIYYFILHQLLVDIGFQGPDPSTDFRGAGVLGLRNLFNYVKNSENSKQVINVALDTKTWYFFCASGINFSGKIIELIEV